MKNIVLSDSVVTSAFLKSNLNADNLLILDASIASVGQTNFNKSTSGIQGVRFIDWKKNFVDHESSLPNMLPDEQSFQDAAQKMGVNNDSAIIVYDQKGMYSSPRVWWMFKSMGFENIAVLDGGLPGWTKNNYPQGEVNIGPFLKGNFTAKHRENLVKDQDEVFSFLKNSTCNILDARSIGRFNGISPEPRPELRSGHIPNSVNLPYSELIKDGFFLPKQELKRVFSNIISDKSHQMIFTCGSGITACILYLAASVCDFKNISVYDGSWSEWGLPSDYPIEK